MTSALYAISFVALVFPVFGYADAGTFKCSGINYNIRAGPDWATADEKCKSASQILTELTTLKSVTDTIRLYSLTDCNQGTMVVPAAIEAGLKIELGIWVDNSTSSFEAEKVAFQMLLETGLVRSDTIVGIHVGSEAVYRGDITVAVAISNLEEIRTLCKTNVDAADIPLTIADIGDTYSAYPELIGVVDYVSANYFPFWEKIDIDDAAASFYKRFSMLVEIASTYNKEVIVGETGWASAGLNADASPATSANAAKFFYDFNMLAREKNVMYFYFSAFDEPWKLATLEANETVEAYFGLFTSEGLLKDEILAMYDDVTTPLDANLLNEDQSIVFSRVYTDNTNVLSSDNATLNVTMTQSKINSDTALFPSNKPTPTNVMEDAPSTGQTTLTHKGCTM